MPKNKPVTVESPTPERTAAAGMAMGTGVKLRTAITSAQAIITPIRPPQPASREDSTRNCRRISERRAPTDLRRPISWVRSETTAIMMFIITMPPTTMKTDTTAIAVAAIAPVSRSQSWMKESEEMTAKLSSWPGRSLRHERSSARASSCAWKRVSWLEETAA